MKYTITALPLAKTLREKRWTIQRLSKETGISTTTLYKFSRDEKPGIQFKTLAAICSALDCNIQGIIQVWPDEDPKEKK